ncbi:phage tail protein [Mycetohabitans sp. B2]|uniref:phage tail protein n=1 Tax=Mycetohabitans sp. B2 TaxID=2841274 RepID=UPI001F28F70E|nr:phage tail protein [Mycetohabitans sp. B2]MCF7696883.1 phage tail protein [Mycetohabitans sp. B2]
MSDIFEPAVAHRFIASIFFDKVPSPVDFRFQRISGLSRELQISSRHEGGDNIGNVHLPERVVHGNLILERGVMTLTPLTWTFNDVLSEFKSRYANVVVLLMNHVDVPVCSWTFTQALPVRWQTGDLDATSNTVLINTLELAYREMHWLGAKA